MWARMWASTPCAFLAGLERPCHCLGAVSRECHPLAQAFGLEWLPQRGCDRSGGGALRRRDNIRLSTDATDPGAFANSIAYDIGGERTQVKVATLDAICRRFSPSVIKIDIEGAELLAIRGARELLSRSSPVLLARCTPRMQGWAPRLRNSMSCRRGSRAIGLATLTSTRLPSLASRRSCARKRAPDRALLPALERWLTDPAGTVSMSHTHRRHRRPALPAEQPCGCASRAPARPAPARVRLAADHRHHPLAPLRGGPRLGPRLAGRSRSRGHPHTGGADAASAVSATSASRAARGILPPCAGSGASGASISCTSPCRRSTPPLLGAASLSPRHRCRSASTTSTPG